MAWSSTAERAEGRTSVMTDDELRLTRVFLVTYTTRTEGPDGARTATSIPWVGDAHPTVTSCRVVSVSAAEAGDPLHYDVTVEYSTRPHDPFKSNAAAPNFTDRALRAAEIHYGFQTRSAALEKAYQIELTTSSSAWGVLSSSPVAYYSVVNSAGEPPDPPLERTEYIPYVRVVRAQATYNHPQMMSLIGRINSTTWNGMEPGTVLLAGVTADRVFEANQFYWNVSYEFQFNTEGWSRIVRNDGFRERVITNGVETLTELKDKNGIQLTRPHNLLPNGLKNTNTKTTTYWMWIQGEGAVSFDSLNINLT